MHTPEHETPWKSVREDEETTQVITLGGESIPDIPRDRCTLIMVEGHAPGSTIPVHGEGVVIGRGSDATLRIDDRALSRRHAAVYQNKGRWFVRDFGSTNGTWIDCNRVRSPSPLRDGARIKLGKNILFRVALQNESEQQQSLEMYQSTVTDPLTRVYNRRYLDGRLEEELAYSQRHGTPLSLILLDVDHFKQINDTLGHPAGDAVLRVMGGAVSRMIRTEDVVARYGGEEFAVVARGIDAENAAILAERIRKLVEGLSIPWEGRSIRITISLGVATCDRRQAYSTTGTLVQAADQALYRAKESGRNRLCRAHG
ncbi:MAG: GGDEF domain-containing protein [Myxococcota bacterium]